VAGEPLGLEDGPRDHVDKATRFSDHAPSTVAYDLPLCEAAMNLAQSLRVAAAMAPPARLTPSRCRRR
jgi:hypothetical protein